MCMEVKKKNSRSCTIAKSTDRFTNCASAVNKIIAFLCMFFQFIDTQFGSRGLVMQSENKETMIEKSPNCTSY